jgi:hypothetical protein
MLVVVDNFAQVLHLVTAGCSRPAEASNGPQHHQLLPQRCTLAPTLRLSDDELLLVNTVIPATVCSHSFFASV